jgi:isopenicillin N synthase-like dioxygenase
MGAIILNTNKALDLRVITALARELNIDMFTISKEEQEKIEDLRLLSFMQNARKEGLADTEETLSKLGIV